MDRFESACTRQDEIIDMTDEELAIAIRSDSDSWDMDLLRELCWRADLLDEWIKADGETFEDVAYKAAEIVGVEI